MRKILFATSMIGVITAFNASHDVYPEVTRGVVIPSMSTKDYPQPTSRMPYVPYPLNYPPRPLPQTNSPDDPQRRPWRPTNAYSSYDDYQKDQNARSAQGSKFIATAQAGNLEELKNILDQCHKSGMQVTKYYPEPPLPPGAIAFRGPITYKAAPAINDSVKAAALTGASEKGHADVVAYLIEQGANILAQDKNGKTVLDLAIQNKQQAVIETLRTKIGELISENDRNPQEAIQKQLELEEATKREEAAMKSGHVDIMSSQLKNARIATQEQIKEAEQALQQKQQALQNELAKIKSATE